MRKAIRSLSPQDKRRKEMIITPPKLNIKSPVRCQRKVGSQESNLTQQWNDEQTRFLLKLNTKVNQAKKAKFAGFRSPLLLNQKLKFCYGRTSNGGGFSEMIGSPKLRVSNNL